MNVSITNCSNDYPSTYILYQELKPHKSAIILTAVSGVLWFITIVIYVEELVYLVRNSDNTSQLKKCIYLLGLYPVISTSSVILLLIPVTTLIADIFVSTYLSFAIFTFVRMIIEYFDGAENLILSMTGEKLSFATPPLCCCFRCCLNNISFTRNTLNLARLLVLQVIYVRPVALLVSLLLWMAGKYTPGDESSPVYAVFYTNLINILSSLSAIWGLVVLFRATYRKLATHSIIIKFASLQIVIVLYNVQNTIISQLAKAGKIPCEGTRGPLIQGIRIHHFLLILEMLITSVLARFAYRRPLD